MSVDGNLRQELPNRAEVTLSEALSWLAFGRAETGIDLARKLDGDTPESALNTLNIAINHFIEAFKSGLIVCNGRYAQHREDRHAAPTETMPSQALHDFQRFNPEFDALLFGESVKATEQWFDYWVAIFNPDQSSGRNDGYYGVNVNRADLLTLRSSLPSAPAVSHLDVVQWCRAWMTQGNGNGMDKAWEVFTQQPIHRGLTRDDVFRPAWKEAKTT